MFLNRKSKGVTLVELLVSLNIIAFGIFIMAIVMIMLLKSGQTSIDNSSAYIVADSVMKQYISERKGDVNRLAQGLEDNFSFSGKNFRYRIEGRFVDGSHDTMVYLRATVTEIEADGGSTKKEAVISTLVSPRTQIN